MRCILENVLRTLLPQNCVARSKPDQAGNNITLKDQCPKSISTNAICANVASMASMSSIIRILLTLHARPVIITFVNQFDIAMKQINDFIDQLSNFK